MILTTRLRGTTLQLRHIFLTEARTFILNLFTNFYILLINKPNRTERLLLLAGQIRFLH